MLNARQKNQALSKLDTALSNLNTLSDFSVRTAISSDEAFVTASATTQASSGSFSIIVDTVAQGSRLESVAGTFASTTDTVGSGNLTLTAGANTFNVAVGATDTLDDIRDAINTATDNFGVNVNIVNGLSGPVLSITSSITGDTSTLVISNDNASLDSISTNLTTQQTANGAAAQVNGIAVTSDTNSFVDAIQDITFTAVQTTTPGSPITLDIGVDKAAVKTSINAFVTAVNEFQTLSQSLAFSSADSVGALVGDVTLRLLNQQVVTTLQNNVTGLTSNYDSLNSLGITFDEFGKLNVDDTALDAVLTSNFDDIANVFASTNGVSISL